MTPITRYDLGAGLSISRILTGLWQVADQEREGRAFDRDRAADAMGPYVAAGFTTFDMADHYGSAEEIVGRFRARPGAPPTQLLTKWVPEPGPITRGMVQEAVDRACRRMQVERIDLLQFHAWSYAHPAWLDALVYLDELRQAGRIAHLGLTNTDTAHLRLVVESGIPIATNQICYSLLDQRAAGAMAEYCARRGVALLAFGTLAGGFLTDRWLGAPEPAWERLETWSQMKYGRFIRIVGGWEALQRVLRAARAVADRHRVSIANVATRYILDAPAVGGVIIGARLGERAHLEDNARTDALRLTADDRATIAEALATLEPVPGDCGDEYRKPPFLTASGDLSHHVASFPAPYAVETASDGTRRAFSGTPWETSAGYARAVRVGDRILVSGTTATHGDRAMGGPDAYAQAHHVFDKIEGAVQSLGGTLADVVRTRIFVSRMEDWEAVARAHGERFGEIRPANTLVRAELIGAEYLVEIEAEAVVR
ncbi:MAG: aldo/keto reductase [Gemmatimonadaceae bacterium]|jgi:aryl-alcohol dehydrogenase-like predicted oxidoreductase/enamine deaminase RidA (YjgF/YER057c/UK114 family)